MHPTHDAAGPMSESLDGWLSGRILPTDNWLDGTVGETSGVGSSLPAVAGEGSDPWAVVAKEASPAKMSSMGCSEAVADHACWGHSLQFSAPLGAERWTMHLHLQMQMHDGVDNIPGFSCCWLVRPGTVRQRENAHPWTPLLSTEWLVLWISGDQELGWEQKERERLLAFYLLAHMAPRQRRLANRFAVGEVGGEHAGRRDYYSPVRCEDFQNDSQMGR